MGISPLNQVSSAAAAPHGTAFVLGEAMQVSAREMKEDRAKVVLQAIEKTKNHCRARSNRI
jgi:hypothetical protein